MKQVFKDYFTNLGYTENDVVFKNFTCFYWTPQPREKYTKNIIHVLLDSPSNFVAIEIEGTGKDKYTVFRGVISNKEDLDAICRITNIKNVNNEA